MSTPSSNRAMSSSPQSIGVNTNYGDLLGDSTTATFQDDSREDILTAISPTVENIISSISPTVDDVVDSILRTKNDYNGVEEVLVDYNGVVEETTVTSLNHDSSVILQQEPETTVTSLNHDASMIQLQNSQYTSGSESSSSYNSFGNNNLGYFHQNGGHEKCTDINVANSHCMDGNNNVSILNFDSLFIVPFLILLVGLLSYTYWYWKLMKKPNKITIGAHLKSLFKDSKFLNEKAPNPPFLLANPHVQFGPFLFQYHVHAWLWPFKYEQRLIHKSLLDGEDDEGGAQLVLDVTPKFEEENVVYEDDEPIEEEDNKDHTKTRYVHDESKPIMPIVFLLHGWTGHSLDLPGSAFVRRFTEKGFRVIAVNRRSHGVDKSCLSGNGIFHLPGTDRDLESSMLFLRKEYPIQFERAKIFLVGTSAGTSVATLCASKWDSPLSDPSDLADISGLDLRVKREHLRVDENPGDSNNIETACAGLLKHGWQNINIKSLIFGTGKSMRKKSSTIASEEPLLRNGDASTDKTIGEGVHSNDKTRKRNNKSEYLPPNNVIGLSQSSNTLEENTQEQEEERSRTYRNPCIHSRPSKLSISQQREKFCKIRKESFEETFDEETKNYMPQKPPMKIAGVVCICPGMDIEKYIHRVGRPYYWLLALVGRMQFFGKKKQEVLRRRFGDEAVDRAISAKNVVELVDACCVFNECKTKDEYFYRYNAARYLWRCRNTPIIGINAADDPLTKIENLTVLPAPYKEYEGLTYSEFGQKYMPNAIAAIPPSGSHCPFMDGGSFGFIEKVDGIYCLKNWGESAAVEFCERISCHPEPFKIVPPTTAVTSTTSSKVSVMSNTSFIDTTPTKTLSKTSDLSTNCPSSDDLSSSTAMSSADEDDYSD